MKLFFALGSLLAAAGVIAGAFGAHALEDTLSPERLETFQVGVRYQLLHALALLAVAWAGTEWPGSLVHVAGWAFVAGIVLFSGSIYYLVLTGHTRAGMITPVGGLLLIVGWLLLAYHTF